MLRRITLAILSLTLFALNASAQLTAHAGPDKVWCHATYLGYPAPVLGDTPAATGGTAPYQYEWISLDFLQADHYLDSTTLEHPTMDGFSGYYDSVQLVLKVTDAANAVATDTVTVHFSYFAYAIPADAYYVLPAGDTASLIPTVISQYHPGGPQAPTIYTWSPATYLSDSTAQYPSCWTPADIEYTLIITDRFGCPSEPATHFVHVIPTSAEHLEKDSDGIIISPIPVIDEAMIQVPVHIVGGTFTMYSNTGAKVMQQPISGQQLKVQRNDLPTGLYYFTLSSDKGQLSGQLSFK